MHIQNEAEIGAAIRESGVPREEVFITSKVSPYQQGDVKARAACEDILQRLGTEYVVRANHVTMQFAREQEPE